MGLTLPCCLRIRANVAEFKCHFTLEHLFPQNVSKMDGKARLRRQLLAGVRDHVSFIDECRVKYGFDRVVSLTPKVETRLRSGDQAKIPLQVQYTHEQARLALVLTLQMDYPASPIEVQVLEAGSGRAGAAGSDAGSREGSADDSAGEGSDADEEGSASDTGAGMRAANLVVLQQHLQGYCDSLVSTEEDENALELQERMRKLAVTIDAKTAAATALPAVALAAAAASRPAPVGAFNAIVGVDIIERFNALAVRYRDEELKLDALGNVVAKVFQFAGLVGKLQSLNIAEAAAAAGEEAGESGEEEGEEVGEEEGEGAAAVAPPAAQVPVAAFKCAICRTLLFTSAHTEPHELPEKAAREGVEGAQGVQGKARTVRDCTSHFLAETSVPPSKEEAEAGGLSAGLRRVPGAHSDDSGTLVCSKCNTKTGAWSWVGLQCSCHTWVCPAFMVNDSKVDKCL